MNLEDVHLRRACISSLTLTIRNQPEINLVCHLHTEDELSTYLQTKNINSKSQLYALVNFSLNFLRGSYFGQLNFLLPVSLSN